MILSIEFHKNFPLLVICVRNFKYNKTIVKLWNCSDIENIIPIDIPNLIDIKNLIEKNKDISGVVFHQILPILAIGYTDNTVEIWDCSDIKNFTLKVILTGNRGSVYSFAFHPTLPYLVTGSDDGLVKLWDCSKPVNTFIKYLI